MSRQSQQWLDEMIKVGFTAPEHGRGDAWHRRAGNRNSYPHEVPYADAFDLIAGWEPVKLYPRDDAGRELAYYGGKRPVAVVHSRTGDLLGMHSESYADHGYGERLFGALQNILDDDLRIGSCGLLDGYRKAWVQVELPDTLEHPASGERYRPFLTAASSLDGSLATTYKRGVTRVVCDNTLAAELADGGGKFKVKNTKNSGLKIASAREALDIVFKIAEDFTAEVDRLLSIKITKRDFSKFLDAYVPVPDEAGRARTIAEHKRDDLTELYQRDPRVSPWKGTAWGVQQAVNTYAEHLATVQNMGRYERSMVSFLKGDAAERDARALDVLTAVIGKRG